MREQSASTSDIQPVRSQPPLFSPTIPLIIGPTASGIRRYLSVKKGKKKKGKKTSRSSPFSGRAQHDPTSGQCGSNLISSVRRAEPPLRPSVASTPSACGALLKNARHGRALWPAAVPRYGSWRKSPVHWRCASTPGPGGIGA